MYSAAVKIAGVIAFALVAFRTAWPAFAYSIEDDREAKRTYSFVLTYLLTLTSWGALALGALAPWWVRLLTDPRYQRAEKGVALLAFASAVYAGYVVLAIGSGRARRTQLNWVVTGIGAAVNVGLNFWLVPAYGMVGAAISTAVSYVVLFVGMTMYAQSVYPVHYQWRRVVTCVGAAVGLDRRRARRRTCRSRPSALLVARVSVRARGARVLSAGGAEATAAADPGVSLRASRSSAASSSALGTHSPAATFARTCSGFVAPAITDATAGIAARPPIATREQRHAVRRPRTAAAARAGPSARRGSRGPRAGLRSPPRRACTSPSGARSRAGRTAASRCRAARRPAGSRPRPRARRASSGSARRRSASARARARRVSASSICAAE